MKAISKVCIALIGATALMGAGFGFGRLAAVTPALPIESAAALPSLKSDGVVLLSPEKLEVAALKTAVAQTRLMATTRQVPARLQYDDRRHIALKVLTDGVLMQMLVKPGDTVAEGQPLAQISSPEIGAARADLWQREAERQIAHEKFEWAKVTSDNVKKLVTAVRKRVSFPEIEQEFGKLNLGKDREQLLAAYSKFLLSESLSASLQSVGESGAISSRTVKERQSERQAAQAALDGLCEVALFDARIERQQAEASASDAERRFEISRQHLHALIWQTQTRRSVSAGDDVRSEDDDMNSELEEISIMTVRAPFAGTIESRQFSQNERVRQGDELFILADTQTLWVKADIRERDWRAVTLVTGQKLAVTVPAMPEARLEATLHYVGREVAIETNAVPIVAVIENAEGHLRPGLFAYVDLPLTEEREVLAVPAASVVEHEGHSFVFIMENENRFRRNDVTLGDKTNEWIEIRSGLKGGEKVISGGAFLLKSELLLEAEE